MRTLLFVIFAAGILNGTARGADPAAPAAPVLAKPGPEHAWLEQMAGEWNATVITFNPDSTTAEESAATMSARMTGGGLWLVSDFTGMMMGKPFSGHEVIGYNNLEKKYKGVWVDSMISSVMQVEGSYDEARRTLATVLTGRDEAGQRIEMRGSTEFSDPDHHVWKASFILPDGTAIPAMEIRYTRQE